MLLNAIRHKQICNKAVYTYPSTIKFAPECFVTQEMCNEAADNYLFLLDSIPDWYKTREICDRAVFDDAFLIVIALITI